MRGVIRGVDYTTTIGISRSRKLVSQYNATIRYRYRNWVTSPLACLGVGLVLGARRTWDTPTMCSFIEPCGCQWPSKGPSCLVQAYKGEGGWRRSGRHSGWLQSGWMPWSSQRSTLPLGGWSSH